jgi:acyl-CoA synthetase (AMP-forming)/AMP-acid ligase II
MSSNWNYADVWDAVAATVGDRPAVSQGDRRYDWTAFERRASGAAGFLVQAGLGHQAKVAQYLYNCPEYLESFYGCFKAGLVPVNTNYRYTDDELVYLWENSDAEAVVFHSSFLETVSRVRDRLPGVKVWMQVSEGDRVDRPGWAASYEDAAGSPPLSSPGRRSGDDLLFIYTGGTTGLPKGVMWRQDDLFSVLNRTAGVRYPEEGTVEDVRDILGRPARYPPPRMIPGPPLMHGTGLFTAMTVLSSGGSVVLPGARHLDVEELLDLIEAERVTEMSIVGDAFAKPILAALDANPDRWDISSMWLMISSGVMWSSEVKEGLLRHNPRMTLVDTLGSSEAVGMARSTSRQGATAATAGFSLGPSTRVLTEDGRPVEPGSGEKGRVALKGRGPIGYYKDPEKSASTFMIIDGERWTIPGDYATVGEDGTVQLLGRGSVCINTGGEKVFPEEVEEILKLHPLVADAVVVGVPDERFGEAVTAVVETRAGSDLDERDLIEFTRGKLAAYKSPKRVIAVDTIGRAPNGKVDYRRLRELAISTPDT